MGVRSPWWRGATFYQIYVRSWKDSNGDGTGDLVGICEELDYLNWLGVDVIWLSPTMPSPNKDWGYDVSDYYGVHPDLGTLEDLDRLISEAAQRQIAVMLDLVPNHTSNEHPWFLDAARRAAGFVPRLLRVGRPEGGRRPAEQLAFCYGQLGLVVRENKRPVLPP